MTASEYDRMAPIGSRIVPLYGNRAAGRVALVDAADYDLVAQHRWNVHEVVQPTGAVNGPYATARTAGARWLRTAIRMHSLIIGRPFVDHADHNTLNNRRSNLRPATSSQNQANKVKKSGCSSRFKGVTWKSRERAWAARIGHNGIHLGYFSSEEEAGRAYDRAAIAAWGEFAYLNFPLPASSEDAA